MKRKNIDKLFKFLVGISAIVVIIGCFLSIWHYPSGNSLITIGLTISIVFSVIDNYRLRKITKEYENKESKDDLDSKK